MASPQSFRWLVAPSESSWQVYKAGEEMSPARELSRDEMMTWKSSGGIVLVPRIGHWVSLPLELPPQDEDDEGLDDMARLQLEAAGIVDDSELSGERIFRVSRVGGKSGRGAVVVHSLTRDGVAWVDSLELTPTAVIWPGEMIGSSGDGVVLWREMGKWVLGVVLAGEVSYAQACGFSDFQDESMVAREIAAVLTSLRAAGVDEIRGLKELRVTVGAEELNEVAQPLGRVAKNLGLRPVSDVRILPQIDDAMVAGGLVTRGMIERKLSAEKRVQSQRILGAALLLWVFGMAYAIWSVFDVRGDVADLEAEVESLRPSVERLSEAETVLREVQFVLDRGAFPLDILVRIDAIKPVPTIRFNDFLYRTNRDIILKGTAQRPDDVIRFGQVLRSSRSFEDFQWETPNPTNNKDSSVSFSFTAKYLDEVTDSAPPTL